MYEIKRIYHFSNFGNNPYNVFITSYSFKYNDLDFILSSYDENNSNAYLISIL